MRENLYTEAEEKLIATKIDENGKWLFDRQIADRLGRSRTAIQNKRMHMKHPRDNHVEYIRWGKTRNTVDLEDTDEL